MFFEKIEIMLFNPIDAKNTKRLSQKVKTLRTPLFMKCPNKKKPVCFPHI